MIYKHLAEKLLDYNTELTNYERCEISDKLLQAEKDIKHFKFLATQARHVLIKKKLVTFDEIKDWQ